ncbi:hypothetical protein ACFYR1_01120 [Streptomyces canus]|uniref:hypothetical protein n=1 Tax=Streptomyces canus TaxID=58343 RepID=UPI0036AF5980
MGRPGPEPAAIERAARLLRNAKPLIVAGGGAVHSGAGTALRAVAEATGIPVADTRAGKGALPWTTPRRYRFDGVVRGERTGPEGGRGARCRHPVLRLHDREPHAWKDSLIGDHPIHGPEGIRFYTRPKVVTTRWPQQAQQIAAGFDFPTSN